ncbi:unnamed protein product, partial [Linum tenue]
NSLFLSRVQKKKNYTTISYTPHYIIKFHTSPSSDPLSGATLVAVYRTTLSLSALLYIQQLFEPPVLLKQH